MKKLSLSKETVRNLDNEAMGHVLAGNWMDNTTLGKMCHRLTACNSMPCCRVE